ncbi:MAG: protein phosphatase 2C domain-containing protein [Oscillospiraceae bacterium]|nr:protein phosphatase 2C domain-containing protein [Oscillospiraceae bacterium]
MKAGEFFRTSSYSEVGESHIGWGKPCEDSVLTGQNPETGVTAAVVSDGAGSYTFAKEGSSITAKAAVELLTGQFDELYELSNQEFAETVLGCIRSLLEKRAEELECQLIDLSATLVCAAVAPDGRYLYFHVGDGIIAACDDKGVCRIISQYYHEIAPNYTTFVTIPDTPYNYGRGKGGVAAFLVTSDGSEYLMTFEDGWLTAQADLLVQMSIFFSPERMESELRQLTTYYKGLGMYDDASFALIGDKRCAAGVFDGMDPDLRQMIFYLPEQTSARTIRQMHDAFAVLAKHPEGVPEIQMMRELHTHKKWNTFHKLAGLLTSEVISLREGKYYF